MRRLLRLHINKEHQNIRPRSGIYTKIPTFQFLQFCKILLAGLVCSIHHIYLQSYLQAVNIMWGGHCPWYSRVFIKIGKPAEDLVWAYYQTQTIIIMLVWLTISATTGQIPSKVEAILKLRVPYQRVQKAKLRLTSNERHLKWRHPTLDNNLRAVDYFSKFLKHSTWTKLNCTDCEACTQNKT